MVRARAIRDPAAGVRSCSTARRKRSFPAPSRPPRTTAWSCCVITALETLKEPCSVDLYSDSKYVVDGITKGWAKGWRARGWVKSDKKPAKNPELWGRLLDLLDKHEVRFHWVKGHADNPYNNRCDELAVGEYQKYK